MPKTIKLNGVEVRTKNTPNGEYLCLTDLAAVIGDRTGRIIGNWIRSISTIEYLKEWELRYNSENFNVLKFEDIRLKSGVMSFTLSVKEWIKETNAIGITSETGRYGGTYAHNAIALEFCSAVSPAFKLGVYVDYIELKEAKAQKWLNTQAFLLKKIEDNTLATNQFVKAILDGEEE